MGKCGVTISRTAIVALGLLSITGPVYSQEGEQSDAALQRDAMQIGRAGSIQERDVLALLRFQERLRPIADRIKLATSDRLAGLFFENEPTPRLVVKLKGDQPAPHIALPNTSPGEVIFQTGARYSRVELFNIVQTGLPRLRATIKGVQGVAADERTGSVYIELYGNDQIDSAVTAVASKIFDAPITLRRLSAPLVLQSR